MPIPLWLADAAAKLVQQAPGASRPSPDVAFTEVPAVTEHITIPTRHGEIPAVRYAPPDGREGSGVYVNFHGGGFVLRHPEQDDPLCRHLAATAGVTVLNVDYTPAPQSRFPGPVEQAYDVAVWAAGPGHPWDGGRLAVGGQSAGGALAAGAARLALENGSPAIRLQVLMYPPLDLTVSASSKKTPDKEGFLVKMGPVFDTVYCPDPRTRHDRLVSPAGPDDVAALTGIAPAMVVTAQRDILHDEGSRYAARLQSAGALVAHLDLPGVGHGFNILGSGRDVVLPVYEAIAHAVEEAFGSAS